MKEDIREDNTRKDTTNKDIREDHTNKDTRNNKKDLYYPMTFNKY